MTRFDPGLTFTPSAQAIQIVLDRLHRAGFPITEPAARSLVEAILAVEGPRMQAIARGIMHGSLETIRQTAELALSALTERASERADLVGVMKEHLSNEPGAGHRRPFATRPPAVDDPGEPLVEEDTRPVFKRRGR